MRADAAAADAVVDNDGLLEGRHNRQRERDAHGPREAVVAVEVRPAQVAVVPARIAREAGGQQRCLPATIDPIVHS